MGNGEHSVGTVQTQVAQIDLPEGGLPLEGGATLPELHVAYETYGVLTPEKDNVVFICHALTGDAHVAGYHNGDEQTRGWWDEMVGPGKGIDTDIYFVVCANILGGCKGTTGPSSLDPRTGQPYGSSFPAISVGDIVTVHRLLLKQLGIDRVAAVVGGSLGGMQALDWAIRFPDSLHRCVCIASAPSLSTQALAFDLVGRKTIMSDPDWQGGDYYGTGRVPARGLSQARMIGHITYLSQGMMAEKFGRERAGEQPGFQVESYLEYQGDKFVSRFDANSYLAITRAMDEYDLVESFGSLEKAFEPVAAKLLIVSLSDDWLFPPERSVEVANAALRAGKRVSYCNLQAPHGHDAFLVDIENLSEVVRAFLPWVGGKPARVARRQEAEARERREGGVRSEYEIILGMVSEGARVLDLGCGSGELLSLLAEEKTVSGIGVDIAIDHVIEVIDRGHDVFQEDVDAGLAMVPDGSYDYAILSETLQVVQKPLFVLRELLRVARECVVSFPNFGQWSRRVDLWTKGRMPKDDSLPFEWYETPNIHLFTLKDFIEICHKEGVRIIETVCLPADPFSRALLSLGLCNLGAERVLVRVTKGGEGEQHALSKSCCRPFRRKRGSAENRSGFENARGEN